MLSNRPGLSAFGFRSRIGAIVRAALFGVVLVGASGGLLSTPAEAACRINGNNIDCDTCADLATAQTVTLQGNAGPQGTNGNNNATCRIRSWSASDQVTLQVQDLASANIPSFEVDYDPIPPNQPPSLNFPTGVQNQTVIVPGGSNSQTFFHTEATAQDIKIQADISDTQSSNANASVSAQMSCTCRSRKGTIVIEKQTTGGTGSFSFTTTKPAGQPTFAVGPLNTTAANPASTTISDLLPGTYSVTEVVPAGWTLTGITCSAGGSVAGSTATINLTAGSTVTCRFNNRKKGAIRINKTSNGGDATFPFTTTGAGFTLPSLTTVGGTATATIENLEPGAYSITEGATAGWSFTSLTCGPGGVFNGQTATITLPPGGLVECTYTNTKRSSITIIKNSVGGNATFPFTTTGAGFTLASLTTSNGTISQTFSDLAAGSYSITEGTTAGWNFTSLSCSGGVVQINGTTANITLNAADAVTCTYTNTKQGTITINKKTVNGDGTFDFTTTGAGLSNFAITTSGGTGTRTFDQLAAGTYTVTETVVDPWTLTTLVCSAGGQSAKPTATITLPAGGNVTCTFTNTKKVASLTLTKTADPSTFTAPGQIITYTYTVKNAGNLTVTSISVTDDKIAGAVPCTPSTLAPGASATCTASYTITPADVTNGSVVNTAKATGKDPANQPVVSNEAKATVTFDKKGHIDRTREVIRNFINRRVDLLASNEPDRARLLRRFNRQQADPPGSLKDGPMKLGGSAEGGNGRFSFAASYSQMRAHAQAEAARKAREAENPDEASDAARSEQVAGFSSPAFGTGADRSGAMRLGAGHDRSHQLQPVTQGGAPSTFDFWIEGHFQRWEDDSADADRSGKFGILYVGADYLVRPGLLVGALVQFDYMDDRSSKNNTDVNGNGWMAGPYMSLKLSDNIIFDARAAWGQSDNSVNPFGVYTDKFDTDRWLAKANLTGNWQFGRLRFTPSIGVITVEEHQKAYVDSVGVTIPGQRASIGRLSFGPEFGYVIEQRDGSIVEPHISFTGMWDFDKTATTSIGGLTVSNDDFRVKVEGGVIVRAPTGFSMRTTLSYDGLGSDDFGAWGGQVWVNLPLN